MIRLVIADDHKVLLDGLESMLRDEPDLEIVARCSNGEQVLHRLRDTQVDAILLDINMPRMSGLEVMEIIKAQHPEVVVIALSMYKEPSYINRMLSLGAQGYVLKDEGKEEILKAITAGLNGQQYLSREVERIQRESKRQLPPNLGLTTREKDVLRELAKGLSSKQISEHLQISYHTVRTHRKHLLQKFQVQNVTSLILKAQDLGIV